MTKCRRCTYLWLPCGTREIPKTGKLYMTDIGICARCGHAKARLRVASPGDQVDAMLWGEKFEVRRIEKE